MLHLLVAIPPYPLKKTLHLQFLFLSDEQLFFGEPYLNLRMQLLDLCLLHPLALLFGLLGFFVFLHAEEDPFLLPLLHDCL